MGRRAIFERVYSEHAAAVKAYVLRRAPASRADDVVSEVFTVCWRRLEDLPEDPLPWLLRVAANVLHTDRRGEARRERLHRRAADAASSAPDWAPAPRDAGIGQALARLRRTDRELLLLIAWEGLSPAQAAVALGVRAGTVRVRLHRARARLRLELERQECEESPSELSMEGST